MSEQELDPAPASVQGVVGPVTGTEDQSTVVLAVDTTASLRQAQVQMMTTRK